MGVGSQLCGMSVGGGGAGNRGDGVVSSRGDAGVAGGGARTRKYCRFSKIFEEIMEDPPYRLPSKFNISDFFL